MEAEWIVDRSDLRTLLQQEPTWSYRQYATHIGRSLSWVKKWVRRLCQADPDDDTALNSRSRARHHPPPTVAAPVVKRILALRDDSPLARVLGPVGILYYLHRDKALKAAGHRLPTSSATIWKILDRHQRILRPKRPERKPMERPEPMVAWQMDYKDVSVAKAEETGKVQHQVETLNIVDVGTSILVANPVRTDFHAATTIETLAQILQVTGKPESITFDRDPRFVASPLNQDFPSALLRFLSCIGIRANVCPPRRPDLNAFVERFNGTYTRECLQVHCPQNEEETAECNAAFQHHYNYERPNQAITCGNQPPRVAFPELPELPPVPDYVDPDSWLHTIHGRRFIRRVSPTGRIKVNKQVYYLGKAYRKQYVVIHVDAKAKQLVVRQGNQELKRLSIKGLHECILSWSDYVQVICREAVSEWQQYKRRRVRYVHA